MQVVTCGRIQPNWGANLENVQVETHYRIHPDGSTNLDDEQALTYSSIQHNWGTNVDDEQASTCSRLKPGWGTNLDDEKTPTCSRLQSEWRNPPNSLTSYGPIFKIFQTRSTFSSINVSIQLNKLLLSYYCQYPFKTMYQLVHEFGQTNPSQNLFMNLVKQILLKTCSYHKPKTNYNLLTSSKKYISLILVFENILTRLLSPSKTFTYGP